MASGTNWWAYANQVRSYGLLSLFTVAFVTQTLFTYGFFPWLNRIVWLFGVGLTGPLISVAYLTLLAIAYEVCFNSLYGPFKSIAEQAAHQISFEFAGFLGLVAIFSLSFAPNRRIWYWAQTRS